MLARAAQDWMRTQRQSSVYTYFMQRKNNCCRSRTSCRELNASAHYVSTQG